MTRRRRFRPLMLVPAIAVVLASAVAAPAAGASDASEGTIAQAVCMSQISFPSFASYGDCIAFVVDGGAVGVSVGTMQDEQIVISAVIQNGVFTHLAASNATATCVAFGTATMADGGEIRVDVGPGESAAVPIPAELGGVEVFRFKGDIPGERKGGFGLTFTSFTGFGGGAAC